MSANLYETKDPGRYYHIHGSLEANTQLKAIGLEPFRPDLETHEEIVDVIEPAVRNFTVQELEALNYKHRQAGVEAMKYEDFIKTQHVRYRCLSSSPELTRSLGESKQTGTAMERHVFGIRFTPSTASTYQLQ